jgi:hypothetical protein
VPSPYDPRLSVKAGGMLYVQSRNTHLKASPSPTADTLAVLQPYADRDRGSATSPATRAGSA